MQRILFIATFLSYGALVSYLSLSTPSGITDIGSWDKIAHCLAYIGFALFSCLLAQNQKQLFSLLGVCACYGILIEYLQSLTGYRIASFNDELANIAGLSMGFIIARTSHHFFPLAAFKKGQ